MNNQIIRGIIVALLLAAGICAAAECEKTCESPSTCQEPNAQPDPVDTVLKQLNDKTLKLTHYEAMIEYKTIQPLYESEAIRKGVLYYAKFGEKSNLRINFQTLKHDDEKEEKYIEQYIFDGAWLTQINYQIKAVKKYQLAEPNKPVDAFDVASNKIPLIGFAKTENLKKQFDITLVENKNDKLATFFQLHLKVKPNSTYKDDYVSLDFWVDKKLRLPTKIVAVSTEEDIYEIRLLKPKIDEKIDEKVFEFKIPRGFGEPEIIPLEKKEK
ncbi:MAG TPA: hypothetical protein VJJ98_11105 [Sedimentisphaerales bacterium]|nr:hypothetical protein [Sedimentisphaerales bacterium]